MRTIALFSLAISLALFCFLEPAQADLSSIPFNDDFEGYLPGTPLINGLNGWYASDNSAMVQSDVFYAGGSQAAQIPADCYLSNRFDGVFHTNVWLQMDVYPSFFTGEDQPDVDTNSAISFYFNSDGYLTVCDGISDSPHWITLTNTITGAALEPMTGTNWARLDIRLDYKAKTWDLFVNYVFITNQLSFVNTNVSIFNSLSCYNGVDTSYLDNVWIMTTNPPDLSTNGCNWLPYMLGSASNLFCTALEGVTATSQTYTIWETNGYYPMWFTNTISDLSGGQNWMTLSPATGLSTGDQVQIQVDFSTLGLAPGTYTGLITAAGFDTNLGFQAGHSPLGIKATLRVETNLPTLCVSPASLEQTIQVGNNPTNQKFEIWNGSAAPVIPMGYGMTCVYSNDLPNFKLTATNGICADEHDTISLVFSDMSDYVPGVYTGRIMIAAWDMWPGYKPPNAQILTANIEVKVHITGLEQPADIQASAGTHSSKVAVSWAPSYGAATYEIWRYTTMDQAYASQIAIVSTTNFDDISAAPGALYYYWVRPVNSYGVLGAMSSNASGYRALEAPAGVRATDGLYADRVVLSWTAVDGASSYHVYRAPAANPEARSQVYHTAGLEYTDLQVVNGTEYLYQVQAARGPYSSALSEADKGYVLSRPTKLNATKGAYATHVGVSWNPTAGATGYEVWRSLRPQTQSSLKIAHTTVASYDDASVTRGTKYYYWVRAKNSTAVGAFSGSDSGYAAVGAVGIALARLVVLPNTMPIGSHPAVVSFRMHNNGPSALAPPNTAMQIDFYMGRTKDIRDAMPVGSVKQHVALAAGQSAVVSVNQLNNITMPSEPGDYHVFIRATPVLPNSLKDVSQGSNETIRAGMIHLTPSGSVNYWSINDYDGDGISDLVVYQPSQGFWAVRAVDGRILGQQVPLGDRACTSILGDYDGDRKADPAVYDAESGLWSVMLSGSGYATAWVKLGGPGCVAVPGDYDGDGKIDPVIYETATGKWAGFLSGSVYAYAEGLFGAPGFRPVPGDYDGNGIWDLALYQESTGLWFIIAPGGGALKAGEWWGAPGYQPVSGDFDGDGCWDLAVYSESTGLWYIKTMAGTELARGIFWGAPGYRPASGDYDGDGCWDLAVYQTSSGRWYIRSLTGRQILMHSLWGSSDMTPVTW